jgi:hypothetical protein
VIRQYYPRLLELDTTIAEHEIAIEDLRRTIRAGNASERRRAPDPGTADTVKEHKRLLKDLRLEHRTLRKEAYADPSVRAALDGLDANTLIEAKVRRASSGVHWGTYLSVEQGLSGIRSGAPPRFVGRQWPGKLAVQLQGGASWEELLAGHGQAHVEVLPLPEGAFPGGRRSKRPRCVLHMRIGSEGPGNRKAVMAAIPFVLHRPLPESGKVKWIYLIRRQRGTKYEWEVQFVVAQETWTHADSANASGACAIDFGWRVLETGDLRVAYAVGSDGHREELIIPAARLARWRKPPSLQSVRDQNFDIAKAGFVQWLAAEPEVPDWLGEATATLGQWRSPARLAGLVIRWREQRFDGDAEIYERIEAWRKQDQHLYDWQGFQGAKDVRWRDDHYRRFAARLRWRYATVIIEDADWKSMLVRPVAEEDETEEWQNTRWFARIASPGRLRSILEAGHPDVRRAPSAYTTSTCRFCGYVDENLDTTPIVVQCSACGETEDQDVRAGYNLLASAETAIALANG